MIRHLQVIAACLLYSQLSHAASAACQQMLPGRVSESQPQRANAHLLKTLGYDESAVGHDPTQDSTEPIPTQWEHYVPDFAIDAFGGWLTGLERGEWGGALTFVREETRVVLLEDGIHDLVRMPFGYLVLTGIEHMMSRGMLYVVRKSPAGTIVVDGLAELSAAPDGWFMLANGTVVVETSDGNLAVHTDGSYEKTACARAGQK